jgi:predicted HD phosphohydrolase
MVLEYSEDAGAALVVTAALHDIGHHPSIAALFPSLPHEGAGARLAVLTFGRQIAWIISHHVAAKRYLVSTDGTYRRVLSDPSLRSSQHEDGLMTRV